MSPETLLYYNITKYEKEHPSKRRSQKERKKRTEEKKKEKERRKGLSKNRHNAGRNKTRGKHPKFSLGRTNKIRTPKGTPLYYNFFPRNKGKSLYSVYQNDFA